MYLMIGVVPLVILVTVALHIKIKNNAIRMLLVSMMTIGMIATGAMHLIIIGVMLICVEIIINKIKESING